MTLTDITLPEVKVYVQSGKFFRRGEQDFVEISFVGAKDTLVERVKPSHMAQFRSEWDAYCDGRPMRRREGTPLTDLPGLDPEKAENYVARNIHTLEELAALSDAQCQGIGHGTLTDREGARKLVTQRMLGDRDQMQRAVHQASATIGSKPAEQYAPNADLDFVKAEIAELKKSIADLAGVVAMAKRPRGKSKASARRQEAD